VGPTASDADRSRQLGRLLGRAQAGQQDHQVAQRGDQERHGRLPPPVTAPAGEVEQLMYGYSITCCLGDCMSHQPSAETGTVMRTDTLTRHARRAGFDAVDVLPIEDDFFRFFYRLSAG
jgi:hypothetical protein